MQTHDAPPHVHPVRCVDAHCHLDDPRLFPLIPDLLERATKAGVQAFVCAGFSPERWAVQRSLSAMHHGIFHAFGLHPWYLLSLDTEDFIPYLSALRDVIAGSPRCVAIGEMGLDRSRPAFVSRFAFQMSCFRAQLALARELDIPVVLHCVRAGSQMLEVLKKDGLPRTGGMVHGFVGSLELAEAFVRLGCHVSFGGWLTRPHAHKASRAFVGLESRWLLCETDAPDMSPVEHQMQANEPAYLPLILTQMAALRSVSVPEMAAITTQNAVRLFGLPHTT